MNVIISKYITKNFEESANYGYFMLKNGHFFVSSNYVQILTKIFSVPETTITDTLLMMSEELNVYLFVLNYQSIIEDLEELEDKQKNNSKFNIKNMVLDILDLVIKVKFQYAGNQEYQMAGTFRDIEVDLKKIYHPSLLTTNQIATLSDYLAQHKKRVV